VIEVVRLSNPSSDQPYHAEKGINELIIIRTDSDGSHFGNYMKVVLTVEEARKVAVDLKTVLDFRCSR